MRTNLFESAYDIVLIDLGGVLIELGRMTRVVAWTRQGLSSEEFWDRWRESSTVKDFESGRMSPLDFGRAMVQELDLSVSAEDFLEEFRHWPKGFYPGAEDLIQRLSSRIRVACFTNNNELHWPTQRKAWGLDRLFFRTFASHEMGCAKPDRAAFEVVLKELGCPPGRILYLDDKRANVEAGRTLGLESYQVKGPAEVKAKLRSLDLLPG